MNAGIIKEILDEVHSGCRVRYGLYALTIENKDYSIVAYNDCGLVILKCRHHDRCFNITYNGSRWL